VPTFHFLLSILIQKEWKKQFFTKITIVSNFKVLDFIYIPEKHPTAKQISFPLEKKLEAHLIFTKKLIDFSWEKDKETDKLQNGL
jgi:hypothetical protein